MEEKKIITLRKPVSIGKDATHKEWTELELREPTAGELDKASKTPGSFGFAISLVSIVTGVPRAAIANITQRDLAECTDFFAQFGAEDSALNTPAES